MKKFLFAGFAAAALAAGPAIAADMPVKAPRAAAAHSWAGCYVGSHVGGLWGETKWSSPAANEPGFIRNQEVDYGSYTSGGQIGCNYQTGAIVFGVEADASWADVDKHGIHDNINGDEIFRTKMNWYGSVRGRLGYAWDRSLLYVTGGWAFGDIKLRFENYATNLLNGSLQTCNVNDVPPETCFTKSKSGWVAGAGFEWMLTAQLSARVEYLFYQFEKKLVGHIALLDAEYARPQFHVARVGMNYKFNP